MADDQVIERELRIEAPPEVVFGFFTESKLFPEWMGVAAELDPRPGGIFRLQVPVSNVVVLGEYLEVDPPRRVVFTWGWEGVPELVPPGSSTVEITLAADGDDTLLRVRHSGLPSAQTAFHEVGWDHYLPRLALVARGESAGPDPLSDPAARPPVPGR